MFAVMTLRDVVEKYRALAGGFGRPVALSDFGLSAQETERLFSQFDEDYHISRFFHFTLDPMLQTAPARGLTTDKVPVPTYQINAFAQSHVSLDAEIAAIL